MFSPGLSQAKRKAIARGIWVAALSGHEAWLESGNWQAEGPLAFASSDYATDQAGRFEGAVIAGEDAAETVLMESQSKTGPLPP
jgi:monoamine oxidase